MASNTKEAIVVVVDVGPSMSEAPRGASSSLQQSLDCLTMILNRKMFAESKDQVALVLLGTPGTANNLATEHDGYRNVTLASPLASVSWNLIEYVQDSIEPNDEQVGDLVDALVVAVDHLMNSTEGKQAFSAKRLILFSDVAGQFSDDQLDHIIGSFQKSEIIFNAIGPNLSDDGDGGRPPGGAGDACSKPMTAQQRSGVALLNHILDKVEGESFTFSETIPALSYFQSREVRPTAWKCPLQVTEALSIPTCSYIKLKASAVKTFSRVSAKDPTAKTEQLATLHLNDDEETEIEKSDTVEGHRYGSTLVPFSAGDKEAMKLNSTKCLKMLGVTNCSNIKRHQLLGDSTMMVFADKAEEPACVAFSALVHALYETNMAMVVRKVYQANSAPKIGCLVPHIKTSYECLVYNELPFSDDVRQFAFASLPTPGVTSGDKSKLEPTDKELHMIDDLIDDMDLTKCLTDEDGKPTEAQKPKSTLNPYIQKLYHCLQHRALNPDRPLEDYVETIPHGPTASEALIAQLVASFQPHTDEDKKQKSRSNAASLFKDDDLAPATKTRKLENNGHLEGGMASLGKAKVMEVGSVNPIEDFRSLLNQKDEDNFEKACQMMCSRIQQIVRESFGKQSYGKALDCLKALRAECVKNSEPSQFNDFHKQLRGWTTSQRADFWKQICQEHIGFITKDESSQSEFTQVDAEDFLSSDTTSATSAAVLPPMDDPEDLLDCL